MIKIVVSLSTKPDNHGDSAVYTVGKNDVVEIVEHAAAGEGDKWYYDIIWAEGAGPQNASITREFEFEWATYRTKLTDHEITCLGPHDYETYIAKNPYREFTVEIGTGNPAANPNGENSRWVNVKSYSKPGAELLAKPQCGSDEYIGIVIPFYL